MSDLAEKIISKLGKRNLTLVTAESCTGGLISSAITAKSGASKVFDRGFVTYSDESKTDLLGVSAHTLKTQGSVSMSAAQLMMRGALENSNADIGVAVTGIAGPEGGTDEKPVGLVFIGYGMRGESPKVSEHHFQGSREHIRMATVKQALLYVLDLL